MLSIEDFSKEFDKYFDSILSTSKKEDLDKHKRESQKMHIFMEFVEKVTDLKPEEYSYDTFIIRGKPDSVVGNLIIEFKDNLKLESERRKAIDQLRKYAKELKEKFEIDRYYGLITDGINFILYEIEIKNDNNVLLAPIREFEISKKEVKQFYYFIFQYFFSERFTKKATPENIVAIFGYSSRIFNESLKVLKKYWEIVKNKINVKVLFEQWSKYYTYVTGEELKDEDLFLRHTYLAILTKFLVYFFLEGTKAQLGNIKELVNVITGETFKRKGLEIFDKDFYSWILDEEIRENLLWELHDVLLKELLSFDFSELSTDVLKEIYQNVIERDERASLGEYYTPDFIAEKIVRELLENRPDAKILDPACGSGTFLFIAIKVKKEKLKNKMSKKELVKHILSSVVGIDINPVAVIMARANYLLAIKDLLPITETLRIPVYLANALILQTKTEKDPNINISVFKIPGLESDEYFILPADKDLLDKIGLDNLDKLVELSEELVSEIRDDVIRTDKALSLAEKLISKYLGIVYTKNGFEILDEKTKKILAYFVVKNAQLLWKYIKENKDTFWTFVLKNTYKPLFYKEAFSFVVGNPPWVTYGEISIEKFRNELKQIFSHYGMPIGGIENINNLDIAQAFILHSIYFYLQKWGDLYFVVPYSFINGNQYVWLRSEPNLIKIYKIVDLSQLKINGKGIFNISCCLIKIRKTDKKEIEHIDGEIYEGNITYSLQGYETRNVPYEIFTDLLKNRKITYKKGVYIKAANNILVFKDKKISEDNTLNKERDIVELLVSKSSNKNYHSLYLNIVKMGLKTDPRTFTFVLIETPKFGFDITKIPIKTHPRAAKRGKEGTQTAKKKYIKIIEGYVTSDYLYGILTSDGTYPFGVWNLSIAVLPLKVDYENNQFVPIKKEIAFKDLRDWYEKSLEYYDINDISKIFMRIKQIIYQKPQSWALVYNRGGDVLNLGSSVIDKKELLKKANESIIKQLKADFIESNILQAIVIDYTNYLIEFNSKEEAHYVCAMLQSKWIRETTRKLQTKGVKGPRDICNRPFYFPIPKFSEKSELYNWMLELSKISEEAHKIVEPLLERYIWKEKGIPLVNNTDKYLSPTSVASIRKKIREELEKRKIQQRIDEISYEILKEVIDKNIL